MLCPLNQLHAFYNGIETQTDDRATRVPAVGIDLALYRIRRNHICFCKQSSSGVAIGTDTVGVVALALRTQDLAVYIPVVGHQPITHDSNA